MASYVAKLVYDGEGAAISFCSNLSYNELCDNIRNQFLVLVDKALQFKFTVPPDSTIYRLRNDVDMSMLYMVLGQLKSSWIDINVSTQAEATTVDKQNPAQTPTEFTFSGDDANQFLGCFRREEAKAYMSSAWKKYITHKGQMFERGAIDFRLKLRMYAIEVSFEYTYEINKKDRVTVVFKKRDTEGCNWCVKASLNRYLSSLSCFAVDDANQYLGCFRMEDAKAYMTSSWKSYITHKGQMFERGAKYFREKLRMYAIEVEFEYSYEINKPDRVYAVCKKMDTEGCKWHVKASKNRY